MSSAYGSCETLSNEWKRAVVWAGSSLSETRTNRRLRGLRSLPEVAANPIHYVIVISHHFTRPIAGLVIFSGAYLRKNFFFPPRLIDKIVWLIDWIISHVDMTRNVYTAANATVYIIERQYHVRKSVYADMYWNAVLTLVDGKANCEEKTPSVRLPTIQSRAMSTTHNPMHPKSQSTKMLSAYFYGPLMIFSHYGFLDN